MATPEDVCAALAAQISANVAGLRGQTDGFTVANPPVAVVLPAQGQFIDYLIAEQTGLADYTYRVVILVSKASGRAGTLQLYAYMATRGASSVPAAILADPTLGHVVDYAVPVEAIYAPQINWAGVDYMGAEIIVKVGAE
jgi:hypothetical protein